jgi:hypothetical protein
MALYIGYYSPSESFVAENHRRGRAGEGPDPAMREKVVSLPERLPDSCRVIASYTPIQSAPDKPGVLLVDTDRSEDLQFINTHYMGYLTFRWVPGVAVGATRAEREASTPQAAAASIR